jgi:hypothetical protein
VEEVYGGEGREEEGEGRREENFGEGRGKGAEAEAENLRRRTGSVVGEEGHPQGLNGVIRN